ncbi:hypothetical protein N8I77_011219 [Diaporthe amygdali]|uniref:Uncharacterized protein n=1 Tax=Phomopsis amygdali TaxID=1214568 RepID=A0AAD9VY43_PHOAM|nr:hypothetical protein N8I77_011219 [Diaporthe amygdali]
MERELAPTADFEPLPAYESHDSAVLPAREQLLQEDSPSTESVDLIKQVVGFPVETTRKRFTEFDIFRHAITNQYQLLLLQKLKALHSHEYKTPVSTSPLNVEHFAQTCLSWILSEDVSQQETSIVSQLTGHVLGETLEGSLDHITISTFQDFVLATTLAYTAWRDQRNPSQRLSIQDLHRASYVTGSSLLQRLDDHLDPEALKEAPRPTLQALFLILFGTTLGVAYTTQVGGQSTANSADLMGKVLSESPTLYATMKERLCHLLADKLVVLVELLWAEVDTEAARTCILDGCLMGRWTQSGRFVWGNPMPHYIFPPRDQSLSWLVQRPGGMFQPTPQAAIMRCPEILGPLMPRMDAADRGKRRSMMVVGPTSHGQQMYARMRTHTGSDGPSLFV